jgi:sodium/potassium-transporting ATPase subunit alpha
MPSTHGPLYLQATTACLGAIVVMQIANVFLCRSERDPLHQRRFVSNKLTHRTDRLHALG